MKQYLKTATSALKQSRETIHQYYRQSYTIENKADASPVTIADKTAEEAIRQVIQSNHIDPNRQVLSFSLKVKNY